MALRVKGFPCKPDNLRSNLDTHVRWGGQGWFKPTQQLSYDAHKDAIICNHTYSNNND